MSKKSILFAVFLISVQIGFSQASSRKDLENQKQAIQKELKQINNLLVINNKKKEVAFSDIENLTLKIQRQQEIVKLTNRQINILNDEISQNQKTKANLEKDLEEIKLAYKQMIIRSYKARSGKNKLMFILSAETFFFQAFKRTQYIKQYASHRRSQAKKIVLISENISNVIKDLSQRLDLKRFTPKKQRQSKNFRIRKDASE